jgi:hypothetical protein
VEAHWFPRHRPPPPPTAEAAGGFCLQHGEAEVAIDPTGLDIRPSPNDPDDVVRAKGGQRGASNRSALPSSS